MKTLVILASSRKRYIKYTPANSRNISMQFAEWTTFTSTTTLTNKKPVPTTELAFSFMETLNYATNQPLARQGRTRITCNHLPGAIRSTHRAFRKQSVGIRILGWSILDHQHSAPPPQYSIEGSEAWKSVEYALTYPEYTLTLKMGHKTGQHPENLLNPDTQNPHPIISDDD